MSAQTHSLALGARPAPQIFYPAPRPFVGTGKLYRPGGLTGGNNLTHCQIVPADAPFSGGAITLYNNQATPIVIDACCVAPSAQANDGVSPVDGSSNAVAWTVVAGGPWVIPPGQYTPLGVANFRPGFLKIPFNVGSIARSDISGAPPLLMFRVHVASGQLNAAIPTTSQLDAQAAAYASRRPWNGFYKSGNFAASNQAGIGTPTRSLIAALSVDFVGSVAAKTVLEFGDSTTQGARSYVAIAGTTTTAAVSASTSIPVASATGVIVGQLISGTGVAAGAVTVAGISGTTITASSAVTIASGAALAFSNLHDYNGALMVACDALSTLAKPVYAANCGYQGQTVDQFTTMADIWLNAVRPHIVIGQPWSINDGVGTNQSLADAAFLKSRAILLKAKRSGMTAAWRTVIPSSSLSGTQSEAVRVAINNRCRADPDFPCVDYDAAVSDGGNPARLQSTYDSGDGIHPNAAGYAQIASTKLQSFLQAYI